jgi:L-cystine uptake protein TcyP (sodium:dicarboxylate symporter family)
VNSIRFVAALVMMLIFLSMLGVREQEVSQLLAGVKVMSLVGLIASLVSLVIMVYPIIDEWLTLECMRRRSAQWWW